MKLYSQRPIHLMEARRLSRWLRCGNFAQVGRAEGVTAPAVKRVVLQAINRILDHSDKAEDTFAREFPLVWAMDNKDELLEKIAHIKKVLAADISGYNQSMDAVRKLRAKREHET